MKRRIKTIENNKLKLSFEFVKHGNPNLTTFAVKGRTKFHPKITVKKDKKCGRSVTALQSAKVNQLRKITQNLNKLCANVFNLNVFECRSYLFRKC